MAMVCLGSCVFTIDSMFAFLSGPMSWDASRVAAAVPSGVGFLGAASIWKGTATDGTGRPEVHGLTTATSVWLAAAVGILNGGEHGLDLYACSKMPSASLSLGLKRRLLDGSIDRFTAFACTAPLHRASALLALAFSRVLPC